MEIQVHTKPTENRNTPPSSMKDVPFGTILTDHMFVMKWQQGIGWHSPTIQPYQPLQMDPSAIVFHYGQSSFEGMKAYQTIDKRYVLFRPRLNFERMNQSAQRMCLPELDIDAVLGALRSLLRIDLNWVPTETGTSLYIRPTLLATEEALGLKVSQEYLFFIIMCPVGPYYPEGFNPVRILVEEKYVRAAPGGVGEAKTAGNYAASNLAEKEAKEKGYTQVLWLDAVERKYVEEVGSMNIFFVLNDEIITPQLTGTILPGITRRSILELGRHWGLKMTERRITIAEVIQSIESGQLTEVFGAGTAAVVSPVGELQWRGKDYTIGNGKTGKVAQRFFDHLTGIQYGKEEDIFHWLEPIE